MRAKRALLAALATTTLYLVGILVAAPVSISIQPPAAPMARSLVAIAEAAPASPDTAATAAATGNSLQNPTESGGFGNSPTTNALTAPATTTDPTTSSDPNSVNQESCAQKDGTFAWLFCPFFDGISHTFADGAQQLISGFLAVEPLQQSGPIYDTWNSLRLLADVSFVIIFLVIIFAQTLQFNLSAYTIKRMLPKLVAAAVLVQFSYVVVSAMIDVGNILGAGVAQLIGATVHGGAMASFDLGTLTENLVGGGILVALATVAWELAFPLFLMVLISILAMILTLALRYVILGLLIILAPLAFAAWVLPNTERYFSTWLSTLIKLILMYPIIIALLSVASNVDGLIPAAASTNPSATSGITTTVIKVLVFIACFAAIPQTFKWAGGAMAQAYGMVDGMRSWGHKRVKESDNWKNRAGRVSSRQIERANRMEQALQPMLSSRNPLVKGAGGGMFTAGSILLAGRTGTSPAARQRGSSQLVESMNKELDTLKQTNPRNVQNALIAHYGSGEQRTKAIESLRSQGAEALMDYTKRIEGRQAMVRYLSDKTVGKDLMNTVQAHSTAFRKPEELQMMLAENGKNTFSNPGMFARYNRADPDEISPLTHQPVRLGDINPKAASGAFGSMTAAKMNRDKFSKETWEVMADHTTDQTTSTARQIATVFGESASPGDMQQAFTYGAANFVNNGDYRTEILKAMARNPEEILASAQGRRTWNAVTNQIMEDQETDPAAHADSLQALANEDDGATLLDTLGLTDAYNNLPDE